MTSGIETVDLTRRFGRLDAVDALNLPAIHSVLAGRSFVSPSVRQ